MRLISQIRPDECPPDGYTGEGDMTGVVVVAIILVIVFLIVNNNINNGK